MELSAIDLRDAGEIERYAVDRDEAMKAFAKAWRGG
jgi:hypothetical protein